MFQIVIQLAVVLALILTNGFFALAEMSLVSSRRVRLRAMAEAGDRRAALCLDLLKAPETFLSVVQVGMTLTGILAGAYGGATLAQSLADRLAEVPSLAPHAHALALAAVVVPISYCTLVFGELVPKRLAMAHPERLARATGPSMRTLIRLTVPVVRLLAVSTDLALRLFGRHGAKEPPVTEEDIRGVIREGARHGVLELAERDIMERLLRLTDRPLDVIMTHRSQVDWLDPDIPIEENLQKVLASPHSRFPVARGDLAEVLGVVRAKDLLAACARGRPVDLAALLIQPHYLLETMRGLELLELFKKTPRMPLAMVVDEYGDVQGLVTLTDLFADILGDLPTPGAPYEPAVVKRADGSLLIDAATPMVEAAAAIGIHQPWPEDWAEATLAGFVLEKLGRIPEIGDLFTELGFVFEIVDMDSRRIDRVLVSPAEDTDEGEKTEAKQ